MLKFLPNRRIQAGAIRWQYLYASANPSRVYSATAGPLLSSTCREATLARDLQRGVLQID